MKKIIRKTGKIASMVFACLLVLTMCFDKTSAQAADGDRVRIEFNDEKVTYSDGWNNYEDRQMYSNKVGSYVTLEFEGTGFSILGGLAKNGPIAEVNIDNGTIVEDADFYSANGTGAEEKIYEKKGLPEGKHTAKITFTDRRTPGAGEGFKNMQIAIYAFEELHYSNEERAVTVIGGKAEKDKYLAGDQVKITADTPEAGKEFVKWESDNDIQFADERAASTTFVMPEQEVTVKAVFEEKRTESATFYIDSKNGDDKADGRTPATAWKTLGRAEEEGAFLPGDKILLKAGTEYHEDFAPKGSGTVENPISVDIYNGNVIGKEAGERAKISADGKANSAVLLQDVSYWNLSNLEVTNDAGNHNQKRAGVNVEITQPGVQKGFHLDNLYVHNVSGTMDDKNQKNGGIFFAVTCPKEEIETIETHFADILVENCYVKDVSRTGISVGYTTKDDDSYGYGGRLPADFIQKYYHTNVVIRNNYVENSGGDAIVPMYCNEPLIEYNVSDGASQNTASNPGAMYNAAIWPWRCEEPVFQYNEAFGTVLNGDGQAFDCDFSRGTLYQYNYSHDNQGGFMLVCQGESLESVVRYNISQNDKRNLFMLSNPNEAVVYNNTFYIGEGMDSIVSNHGGKASMYNNILYSTKESEIKGWGQNVTWDNNLYYQCDTQPKDENMIIANPQFVAPGTGGEGKVGDSAIDTLAGYQLQENSPAIDSGKTIENNGGRDYFGNQIYGQADMGAAEYVPVSAREFTITASVNGEGGKISPAGEVKVQGGQDQTFTITPENGYKVADVTVNGKSVGAVAEYTFENVTENGTITATFQKKEQTSSGNTTTGNPNDGQKIEKRAAKTGDDNSVAGLLFGMIAGGSVIAVISRRKHV